jgi:ATP-dependent protease ClpP protease subunit
MSKKEAINNCHELGVNEATRTIYIDNPEGINHSVAMKFIKNINFLESINKNPITVVLASDGGNNADGFIIYDAIKASPCMVTVKVVGYACSMGHTILQAADDRVLTPNSFVMFHAGETSPVGTNFHESFKSAEFDKRYMEKSFKITHDRINEKRIKNNQAKMSKAAFEQRVLRSAWYFPEEAIAEGLADRIEE